MTTVPDVAGKSGSFAEQMLKAANLNVQFERRQRRPGSIPERRGRETSAAYGTIVTLTMESDGSDTADTTDTTDTQVERNSGRSSRRKYRAINGPEAPSRRLSA